MNERQQTGQTWAVLLRKNTSHMTKLGQKHTVTG